MANNERYTLHHVRCVLIPAHPFMLQIIKRWLDKDPGPLYSYGDKEAHIFKVIKWTNRFYLITDSEITFPTGSKWKPRKQDPSNSSLR